MVIFWSYECIKIQALIVNLKYNVYRIPTDSVEQSFDRSNYDQFEFQNSIDGTGINNNRSQIKYYNCHNIL